jgi:hypothetical protein
MNMHLSEDFNAHKASGHFVEEELRFFLNNVKVIEDEYALQYLSEEGRWKQLPLRSTYMERMSSSLRVDEFSPQCIIDNKIQLRIRKTIRTSFGNEYEYLIMKYVSGKMWIGKKTFTPNSAKYMEEHLPEFFASFGIPPSMAYGMYQELDKCEQYRNIWETNGIPFVKGACVYMLGRVPPYNESVRQTKDGWVKPEMWVVDNKEFIKHLPDKIEPFPGAYKL